MNLHHMQVCRWAVFTRKMQNSYNITITITIIINIETKRLVQPAYCLYEILELTLYFTNRFSKFC